MIVSVLLIVVGFVALIFGANWLVDGASALAKKYKVSDLVIGLTIVAFGNFIAGISNFDSKKKKKE